MVNIVKGWNLIPVQDVTDSGDGPSAAAYTAGLDVTRIYTFNTVRNAWDSVAIGAMMQEDPECSPGGTDNTVCAMVPGDELMIGKGYWIFGRKGRHARSVATPLKHRLPDSK